MVSLKGSETGVSDKFVAGKTFAGKCFLEDLSKNAHTVLVSMCKLCVVNSFHSRIEWGEIDPAEKTKLTILPPLILNHTMHKRSIIQTCYVSALDQWLSFSE